MNIRPGSRGCAAGLRVGRGGREKPNLTRHPVHTSPPCRIRWSSGSGNDQRRHVVGQGRGADRPDECERKRQEDSSKENYLIVVPAAFA